MSEFMGVDQKAAAPSDMWPEQTASIRIKSEATVFVKYFSSNCGFPKKSQNHV
jgi:hypothetical protein